MTPRRGVGLTVKSDIAVPMFIVLGLGLSLPLQAGPVIVAGHDADDHGFVTQYVALFNALQANVANSHSGIVSIGSDVGTTAANWINQVASLMAVPQTVTHVNGSNISAVDFSNFAIIHVPSDSADTSGGISQTETDLFAVRASDVANFINNGGGLFGLAGGYFANAYGYLGAFANIQSSGVSFDDITATTEGMALGITNANLDGCCWHNVFTSFAPFLRVLAVANEPQLPSIHNEAAMIGCFDCRIPSEFIVAWGNNCCGQVNVPAPNSGFIAIAGGGAHSLGLKADGSIVAWGYNNSGQCNVSAPNNGFIAVAAGGEHSLGLKANGSIVAWGNNYDGQCNVPAPNSGFIAVAASNGHSLGLKADRSIVAWGWNYFGQVNVPAPNSGFIAVAGGAGHSLGLKTDGSIVAWGWNDYGQCDVSAPNSGFIAIAGGYYHSLGLKADGSIVAWGDNAYGQGNVPAPNSGFIAVTAGGYPGNSLGLKADGSIVAWGDNAQGQGNVPAPNSGFIGVAGGYQHSLGLKTAAPGISAIDRWWAYTGQAVAVELAIHVGEAREYILDLDLPSSGWDLGSGAYVTIGIDTTQHEFDFAAMASLGTLPVGDHVLHINSLQAPSEAIINEITFSLCESAFDCANGTEIDRFTAMFIADRPGLGSVSGLSFEDGRGNSLTINSVQNLVDAFAPKLYFDGQENYFPQSVETTLATSRLGETTGIRDASGAVLRSSVTVSTLHDAAGLYGSDPNLDTLWIDLPLTYPQAPGTINGDDPFSLYATVIREGDEIAISYYIHYGYSNWQQHAGFNDHEGDWESAFVFLRSTTSGGSTFAPDRVAYSQHEKYDLVRTQLDGGQWASWSDLAAGGLLHAVTHPRLYVGLGGHASYFVPDYTVWGPIPCVGWQSYYELHGGNDGPNRPAQSNNVTLLSRAPDAVAAGKSWLVFPGHWGQQSLYDLPECDEDDEGDRGPLGPVFSAARGPGGVHGKRWFDPIGWMNEGDAFDQFVPPFPTAQEQAAPGQDIPTTMVTLDNLWQWDEAEGHFSSPSGGTVTINLAEPTYLLTHGWDGDLDGVNTCADPKPAMSSIGCAIRQAKPNANILAWDWQLAANPNRECDFTDNVNLQLLAGLLLGRDINRNPPRNPFLFDAWYAGLNAGIEGNKLGQALAGLLEGTGGTLGTELHLIGKSHGGGVLGAAATKMSNLGYPPHSLSTLDTPRVGTIDTLRYVNAGAVHQDGQLAVYYYDSRSFGGFGGPSPGNFANLTNLSLDESEAILDGGIPHLWIAGPDGGICPPDEGWYPLSAWLHTLTFAGVSIVPSVLSVTEFPDGCYEEQDRYEFSGGPCPSRSGGEPAGDGGIVSQTSGLSLVAYDPFQTATSWFGQNAELVIGMDPANPINRVIVLREQGDASFFQDAVWPGQSSVLTFEYMFAEPRDAESLTVYLGNEIVYYDNAETTLARGGLNTSGAIYVGNIAGITSRLNFVLRSDGEPGGAVLLDNIRLLGMVWGDADLDSDIDLMDFAAYQQCLAADPIQAGCLSIDVDESQVVDMSDFDVWVACAAGPGTLPNPLCADADADMVPDPADNCPGIANSAQEDCDGDGTGDACEPISDCPDDGEFCNGNEICSNGVCDHTGDPCVGQGESCDEILDACQVCFTAWDGFEPVPPFAVNMPIDGVDYNGDGNAWSNPSGSWTIGTGGCPANTGKSAKGVAQTPPITNEFVRSEYFHTDELGELESVSSKYKFTADLRSEAGLNPRIDWQIMLKDASTGDPSTDPTVILIHLPSTQSTFTGVGANRGRPLVRDPENSSGFLALNPVFVIPANTCYRIEVELDNTAPVASAVKVFINGTLRLTTRRLDSAALRIDYLYIQQVANNQAAGGTNRLALDNVELCEVGTYSPPPDCNLSPGVCDDQIFCNGPETCTAAGYCQPGNNPCPNQLCIESEQRCVECLTSADCSDDGEFCNGTEFCSNGTCDHSGDPCTSQGLICNEYINACVAQDCYVAWDGFEPVPPFGVGMPIDGMDYEGDGSAWSNPSGSWTIGTGGCPTNTGKSAKGVAQTPPLINDPFVQSEYLHTDELGHLRCTSAVYTFTADLRSEAGLNPRIDWQIALKDGSDGDGDPLNDPDVILIHLPSTQSSYPGVAATSRGRMLVRDPYDPNGFLTLVPTFPIPANTCYRIKVELDNTATADSAVKLFVNDTLRVTTKRLSPTATRIDHLHITQVANNQAAGSSNRLALDNVILCETGSDYLPNAEPDCNTNGVLDICDVASGTSLDCNRNNTPDDCDIASGARFDCNLNTTPDDCDIVSGSSLDCNLNTTPDECDITEGSSADANSNGIPDECYLPIGACCYSLDGSCQIKTPATCADYYHTYLGDDTPCTPNPCSPGPQLGGSIEGWGHPTVGGDTSRDFIAVAAGTFHSLGLRSDGFLAVWGDNFYYGQCNGPIPNGDFIAAAAGQYHSLGVKADGSIVAWGWNEAGQCNVPAPNKGFVAVAAGLDHSLGLTADGAIVAWGDNSVGQCNAPEPNTSFVAVAAGDSLSLGLKANGSVLAWGANSSGQCDVPEPNSDFVAIAAGDGHNLGLKADGSIVAWGWNSDGQCNVPEPNTGFIAVGGGHSHSLGVKADGSIVAWGWNGYGQCNAPPENFGFVAVDGGYGHSLGIRADSSIVAWGDNWYGQCGVPAPNMDFVAVAGGQNGLGLKANGSIVTWGSDAWGQSNVPAPNTGFTGIAAGTVHSLGLKTDGSLVAWGRNTYGECNIPAPNTDFIAIAAGGEHSLALKADGSIVAWGSNYDGQCNVPSPNIAFVAVAGGQYHSLGLKADGSIVAWGDNDGEQCNVPAPNSGFVAVAAGGYHSLGLKADGSIIAWGWNYYGQCEVPSPNTAFVMVAGGYYHSLGLKADGSIFAWGGNDYGQCSVPVANTGFVSVAGGLFSSLGLKE